MLSRAGASAAPDAPRSAFGLMFAGYAAGAASGPLIGGALGVGTATWLILSVPPLIALGLVAFNARAVQAEQAQAASA